MAYASATCRGPSPPGISSPTARRTVIGSPPPTIVAQNPDNGHAHLIYGLDVAVRTAPDAKTGPLRYAAAVDCALRALLDADQGYAGLICKNPLHPHWRVTEWEPRLYELGDLDSWLDLSAYGDDGVAVAYVAALLAQPDFRQWEAEALA